MALSTPAKNGTALKLWVEIPAGDVITVQVDPSQPVAHLKAKLRRHPAIGLAPCQQVLEFRGRELEDSLPLSECCMGSPSLLRFADERRATATSSLLRLNSTLRLREKKPEPVQDAKPQPSLHDFIRMQRSLSRSSSSSSLASVASTRSLRASSPSPIRTSGPAVWPGRSFRPPPPSGILQETAHVQASLPKRTPGSPSISARRCDETWTLLPKRASAASGGRTCGPPSFAPGTGPLTSSVVGHVPKETHVTLSASSSLRSLTTSALDDEPEMKGHMASTRAPSSNASDASDVDQEAAAPVFSPMPAPPSAVLAGCRSKLRVPQPTKLSGKVPDAKALEALNNQRTARLRACLSEACLQGRFVQATVRAP